MFDEVEQQGSIFEKFRPLAERRSAIFDAGEQPFGLRFDEVVSATRGRIGDRSILLAGTNNYLGLTYADACIEAAKTAIDEHGTATTGSRLANGTYGIHAELERDLAGFFGMPSAIIFTTGYQANLASISALAGKGDHLLIDADSHACIYDACRLSDAETIRFRHNSPENLDRRLARMPKEGGKLVVIEGLYSMLGDVAPVAEFVEVAHRHGAYLYVDEAHSVGCYGPGGRGVAADQGVLDEVDFLSGTFSKSFASIGGFCVSRHADFEYIRLMSRPYLFTASGSPSTVAAARAALGEIQSDASLRQSLWARAEQLHAGLVAAGFEPSSAPGPVIALPRPDQETAVRQWNQLLERGIYVNLAIPPATPHAMSLLRLSVSAAHTEEDINQIIAAFEALD